MDHELLSGLYRIVELQRHEVLGVSQFQPRQEQGGRPSAIGRIVLLSNRPRVRQFELIARPPLNQDCFQASNASSKAPSIRDRCLAALMTKRLFLRSGKIGLLFLLFHSFLHDRFIESRQQSASAHRRRRRGRSWPRSVHREHAGCVDRLRTSTPNGDPWPGPEMQPCVMSEVECPRAAIGPCSTCASRVRGRMSNCDDVFPGQSHRFVTPTVQDAVVDAGHPAGHHAWLTSRFGK